MFAPVTATRSHRQVAAQIEKLIAEGRLRIGDRIPGERHLARQFTVSRVVIRETMRNLEARGIVEVRQGSGTYIRMAPPGTLVQSVTLLVQLERGSFADLMVVRKSLECTAATLAASRADSESLGAIRQCIDRMSRVAERGLNDPANYFLYGELDQEFHLLIAKASRNVSLESILSAVIPMTMSGRFDIIRSLGNMDIFFGRPDIGVAHDHHNAIASSIASRDPTLAEALVDRHLTRAATIYTSLERLVSEPNAPSASYQE